MSAPPDVNEWTKAEHAGGYLSMGQDWPPHRGEGEAVLLAELPADVTRVLDLGSGDGRLLDVVLAARPGAEGVATDFSPAMLDAARRRFAGRPEVEVVALDLASPLPARIADAGPFDAVVSSFAIHHLTDPRKRELYSEVFALLRPGGLFANFEHVAAPTPRLHARFYELLGEDVADEDPSNKCASVDAQLGWLRRIGFVDVDCLWKWHEMALLMANRPEGHGATSAERLSLP
ncbi:MAG TPA: class I SAM-dependent methyltransferase [Acidimicrobiales bacterium]